MRPRVPKTRPFFAFLYASRALLAHWYRQQVAKTIAAGKDRHKERRPLTAWKLSDAAVLENDRDLWLFLLKPAWVWLGSSSSCSVSSR